MKFLITGGAGSLGKALAKRLWNHEIVIFSRDEGKHALAYGTSAKNIKCYVGDVRDFDRLDFVMSVERPDYVIHAAALKRIDTVEDNPSEAWETNVKGSENVCKASLKNGVKRATLVSTDKACLPANVYGATKFAAERIFSHYAHSFKGGKTEFNSCRYGNVIASRGSFLPLWRDKLRHGKPIPVTHPDCARFLFTVLNVLAYGPGVGEVMIPFLKPYNIIDVLNGLAELVGVADFEVQHIGVRPGEKLHEDMLAITELPDSYSFRFPSGDNAVCVIASQSGYRLPERYFGPPMSTSNDINRDKESIKRLIARGLSEAD
jgi:UDP-N-acetylglucosamine 4,6-dehydratase